MVDFDKIFLKYYASLFAFSMKFVKDEAIASDIVQNIFLSLWERKKLFTNDHKLKAYLFQSVKNNCLNQLKHTKIVQKYEKLSLLEVEYYQSGETSLIEQEGLSTIYKAIDSLSDIHKEVIELSRFEGLKNKEIAERLNLPVRTVETRLFRALAALREMLSDKVFHIFTMLIFRSSEIFKKKISF